MSSAAPDEEADEILLQELEAILLSGAVVSFSPAVPWDPMGWRVED